MNEDKVIQKLIEHDKKLDELVTKTEFHDFKNRIFIAQDEIITILRRLDEERIFTTAWVSRIEKEVEEHKEEIAKIKRTLKIS
ncbi:MAG: hypothetical protein QMD50_03065 [Patescibacteria group bacterium]|nr:hypothetical protein [Patescibacteria group bacterium]